jgi:outer membrane protein assembly factor BamD
MGLKVKRVKKDCWNPLSWLLLAAFLFAASSGGCAFGRKKEPDPTPQVLYEKAMNSFNRKNYESGAEAFKKLRDEFPLSDYSIIAELRTADSYFFNKNYSEAIILYEEFKKLHPMHPEVPYTIYQLGMCHYKQMRTLDRDQTETEKAIEQFRYLIENFPQSAKTTEAKTRMQECLRQLADHEFYVGNFYFRAKRYKAALGRYEIILRKYPDSGLEQKIRPLMATCQTEIAKEEQKRKEHEALEEKKKKEQEDKQKNKKPGVASSG